MTRRTACGMTTKRSAWPCERPSDRAAAAWLGCTESMPARYTSETYAEYTRTSETMPQKSGSIGTPGSPSAGTPNPRM